MHREGFPGRFEHRLAVAVPLLIGGITSMALAGLVSGKGKAKTPATSSTTSRASRTRAPWS
jgi:hypothetical protein